MSTEIDSIPATVYPIVNLDDPDRIVTVKIKASDLWKTRKIIACLSNPSSVTYDVLLSVADESNHADMDYIHRVLYFAEMGWDFITKEEAERILREKK